MMADPFTYVDFTVTSTVNSNLRMVDYIYLYIHVDYKNHYIHVHIALTSLKLILTTMLNKSSFKNFSF